MIWPFVAGVITTLVVERLIENWWFIELKIREHFHRRP